MWFIDPKVDGTDKNRVMALRQQEGMQGNRLMIYVFTLINNIMSPGDQGFIYIPLKLKP